MFVLQHPEKQEIETADDLPGYLSIKQLCDELNIKVISLKPFFQDSLKIDVDPYRDNIHINVMGQQILAEMILDTILSKNSSM